MTKNTKKRKLDVVAESRLGPLSYESGERLGAPSGALVSARKTKSYASSIMAAVHETAEGLHNIGLVDKATMREFDESCLAPLVPLEPQEIKALREREHASQAVFARYLGIATATVGQWERGLRKPDGPALRLLSLIERYGLAYIR